MNFFSKNHKGFTVMIVVIVLSAAALLVALTAAGRGLDETQISLRERLSRATFVAAEGCLEDALLQLNQNHNYAGGALALSGVSCTITVSGSGTTRLVNVAATHPNSTASHLQADADWSAGFKAMAWREMTN